MPPSFDPDQIFRYHAPKGDQQVRYEEIREQARYFARSIQRMTPQSREQSAALTKLQECVMFANAAIAINE